jgi:hypothetical protein
MVHAAHSGLTRSGDLRVAHAGEASAPVAGMAIALIHRSSRAGRSADPFGRPTRAAG